MPDTNAPVVRGTKASPMHYQGPIHVEKDVKLNRQYLTYVDDVGVVAGSLLSVAFDLQGSSADIWPQFKDFNLWQNSYGYYYSRVVGDSEGPGLEIAFESGGQAKGEYDVVRVIPEHIIVLSQPVPNEKIMEDNRMPGDGGVSAGFHSFTLTSVGETTLVTAILQHAAVMAPEAAGTSEDEVLAPWREYGEEGISKWRDSFIPTLKQLVESAGLGS